MTTSSTPSPPRPPLSREQWLELYESADRSASNYWERRYWNDDEGYAVVVQWHPDSAKTLGREFSLWGTRRTEPYGFSDTSSLSIDDWYEQIAARAQNRKGTYIATWLLPLTELAELAGVPAKVRS